MKIIIKMCVVLSVLLSASTVFAEEKKLVNQPDPWNLLGEREINQTDPWNIANRISIFGYASQGWVKTDDNNIYGNSSDSGGSYDMTEAAIATYIQLTDRLNFSGQFLYLDNGGPDSKFQFDYGYFDYNLINTEQFIGGIKLGRVKNFYGLLNEARDYSFARTSITLPDMYQNWSRFYLLSGDGVSLNSTYFNRYFNLTFDGSYNENRVDDSLEYGVFGFDVPGGEIKEGDTYSYRLKLDVPNMPLNGLATFAYSGGNIKNTFDYSDQFFKFNNIDIEYDMETFSFSYATKFLTYTTEYAYIDGHVDSLGALNPVSETENDWYYHQLEFHVKPELDLYVRYDVGYNSNDKYGKDWEASAPWNSGGYHTYIRGYTYGLSYYFSDDLLLRAEYHDNEGTLNVPAWNNDHGHYAPAFANYFDLSNGDAEKNWGAFMMQLSYKFKLH